MRTYVATSGAIFGLLVLAHVWRAIEEPRLVRDPWFSALTAIAAGLCVWAFVALRRRPDA